jgi:ADP-ribosylglycohydrolase
VDRRGRGTAGEMGEAPARERDRFRGCLLGVAIGDALGRPAEGKRPSVVRERYGSLTDFHPWRGWRGGPVGTITDDTQMTMCIARSIIERRGVDPADIARRFVEWLPTARGKGRACTEAVLNLRDGSDWESSGVDSAGNGAAMRVAPVGMLHLDDRRALRRDAELTAVITHTSPTAVASAVAQAAAVAYCLRQGPTGLQPDPLLTEVVAIARTVPDRGVRERRPGAGDARIRRRPSTRPVSSAGVSPGHPRDAGGLPPTAGT